METAPPVSATPERACSRHQALLYEDPAHFVDGAAAFVRAGLRGGEKVLAAATPAKLAWLREELGTEAGTVDFADADVLYARNGPMFKTVVEYLERHARPGAGRARILAEQPLGQRAPAAVRAYMRYEAAANVAYGAYDACVVCPYDTGRLPEEIVQDALRTHPEVREDHRLQRSPLFTDPRSFVRGRVRARGAPPEARRVRDRAGRGPLGRPGARARGGRARGPSGPGDRGPGARGQRGGRQRARPRRRAAQALGLPGRGARSCATSGTPGRGSPTRSPATCRRTGASSPGAASGWPISSATSSRWPAIRAARTCTCTPLPAAA